MATAKPIAYPKLTDVVASAVDAYAVVHDTVRNHAQEHGKTLDQRRDKLSAAQAAKKLIEGDGKS